MKERPILFSAPMVRALLDGTKTQTRRSVKECSPWPGGPGWVMSILPDERLWPHEYVGDARTNLRPMLCHYGEPGDRLWVKETFGPRAGGVVFRADDGNDCPDGGKWRPSIFMPRWASRITLEITDVRVQRLHDISEEDAVAEGIERADDEIGWRGYDHNKPNSAYVTPLGSFFSLWRALNGAPSYALNPWVWAMTFKRVTP